MYSTYLGGSDNEAGNDIAVDSAGNAYVTGLTNEAIDPARLRDILIVGAGPAL